MPDRALPDWDADQHAALARLGDLAGQRAMAGEREAWEGLAPVPDAGCECERDHEGDPEVVVVLDPDLMLL
jgi:hypothetical protein